ncbi:MAG: hypothetical protein GY862_20765 [Gammaproteobacteria bacterium]|nr:hypothetical protein [Gammaproteobacteria bacterium]
MTAGTNESDSIIQIWNNNNLHTEYIADGTTIALLPFGIDAIRVYSGTNGLNLSVLEVGDHDEDGMPGWWEQLYGLSDADANDVGLDSDADGLTNFQEFNEKTIPNNADIDRDGLSDGAELNIHATDPFNPDSDTDNISDGDEVKTLFMLMQTGNLPLLTA